MFIGELNVKTLYTSDVYQYMVCFFFHTRVGISQMLVMLNSLFKSCMYPHLTLGDYEKLWSAVTGGRGTGRGKKRTKPKDKEAVPTGFGEEFKEQINFSWKHKLIVLALILS